MAYLDPIMFTYYNNGEKMSPICYMYSFTDSSSGKSECAVSLPGGIYLAVSSHAGFSKYCCLFLLLSWNVQTHANNNDPNKKMTVVQLAGTTGGITATPLTYNSCKFSCETNTHPLFSAICLNQYNGKTIGIK